MFLNNNKWVGVVVEEIKQRLQNLIGMKVEGAIYVTIIDLVGKTLL